jgi:ribonuclease BN (tRNA processing enzyme)
MSDPVSVSVRTYQVGFGDCFLLSIAYADATERHVLIDFGTTKLPPDAPKSRMVDIARNIAERCNGKLTAVIATHRHQDHISGFATDGRGESSGSIIAGLDPSLIIQPWTEHPDLPVDGTTGYAAPEHKGMAGEARALASMQVVAANHVAEARRNHQYMRSVGEGLKEELSFIGEDNISNASAVRNLMEMGHGKGRGEYLHAGEPTELARLLDVEVDVFGPPTVQQRAEVRKQRARDPGEYWHLAASAPAAVQPAAGGRTAQLFPDHMEQRTNGEFPIEARWLISRTRRMRGHQMLRIVRMLDQAMNNTSLILLFRIGSRSLLFPGDAQIENWSYALEQPPWLEKLSGVDLYKVGHHGSLNATPKSLWKSFWKKSEDAAAPDRLRTLMSTLEGKHGHAEDRTEVPRETLVNDLRKQSNLFTTQSLVGDFWHDSPPLDVR